MGLIPWSRRTEKDKVHTSQALAPTTSKDLASTASKELVPTGGNNITIHRGGPTGAVVQVRRKELVVAGKKVEVDPHELIRLIKNVTQTIGEYKHGNGIYAAVVVSALRKARNDLVNTLEQEFHIHWQINKETGESVFYM